MNCEATRKSKSVKSDTALNKIELYGNFVLEQRLFEPVIILLDRFPFRCITLY